MIQKKIVSISSKRNSNQKVYADLIYEWEDYFSSSLALPIKSNSFIKEKLIRVFFRIIHRLKLSRIIQMLDSIFSFSTKYKLLFTLYPHRFFNQDTSCNKIPYIIDFDYNVNLESFYKIYSNCYLVIISSRVAFDYLKEKNCPLNIAHVPLSLSVKESFIHQIKKPCDRKIDVFIARQNVVLMDYIKRFASEYPNTEFVYRKWETGEIYSCNAYYSNKRGRLGEFSRRETYFNLLKDCKVALYSTPGCDSKERRFMNHVTPSIFEYLSCGCHVIARYTNNSDTDYFSFQELLQSVSSYDDFKNKLSSFLSDNSFAYYNKNLKYLNKYSSERQVEIFRKVLENNNIKI